MEGLQCNGVIAPLTARCMLQEISKIVGEMWQRATPEEKAPYVEQVSMHASKHLPLLCTPRHPSFCELMGVLLVHDRHE